MRHLLPATYATHRVHLEVWRRRRHRNTPARGVCTPPFTSRFLPLFLILIPTPTPHERCARAPSSRRVLLVKPRATHTRSRVASVMTCGAAVCPTMYVAARHGARRGGAAALRWCLRASPPAPASPTALHNSQRANLSNNSSRRLEVRAFSAVEIPEPEPSQSPTPPDNLAQVAAEAAAAAGGGGAGAGAGAGAGGGGANAAAADAATATAAAAPAPRAQPAQPQMRATQQTQQQPPKAQQSPQHFQQRAPQGNWQQQQRAPPPRPPPQHQRLQQQQQQQQQQRGGGGGGGGGGGSAYNSSGAGVGARGGGGGGGGAYNGASAYKTGGGQGGAAGAGSTTGTRDTAMTRMLPDDIDALYHQMQHLGRAPPKHVFQLNSAPFVSHTTRVIPVNVTKCLTSVGKRCDVKRNEKRRNITSNAHVRPCIEGHDGRTCTRRRSCWRRARSACWPPSR